MKGIYEQLKEAETINYENIDFDKLNDYFKKSHKEQLQKQKAEEKRQKNNLKELEKRSKELGKEIPLELMAIVASDLNKGGVISSSMIKKYNEWF